MPLSLFNIARPCQVFAKMNEVVEMIFEFAIFVENIAGKSAQKPTEILWVKNVVFEISQMKSKP